MSSSILGHIKVVLTDIVKLFLAFIHDSYLNCIWKDVYSMYYVLYVTQLLVHEITCTVYVHNDLYLRSRVLRLPWFRPRMREVNDKHKLYDDEEHASNKSNIHPSGSETTVRNKECANKSWTVNYLKLNFYFEIERCLHCINIYTGHEIWQYVHYAWDYLQW